MKRLKLLLLPLLLIASLVGFDRSPAEERPAARSLVRVDLAMGERGGDYPLLAPANPRQTIRPFALKIIVRDPARYAL
ncbi:hypothetical protein [Pseudomonas zhanjiangensis]|uniref:Uncharacterized protein n=1 Tax=Pseudomonas zhanjiangensis TaxID=3239015 RepID=A0ABV3YYA0_9PSED